MFGILLQERHTRAASFVGAPFLSKRFLGAKELVVTLQVHAAERDSANETYDVYITTGDGKSQWDIAHFPQINTTGAKTFTARILTERLAQVTTASPGVASETSGAFKTDTAGANEGVRTLAAGVVRHGPIGDRLNHELVVAGTVSTGIDYSLTVEVG